jgi:hypothetical protein
MADPVGNALQNILCPRRHILFAPSCHFKLPKNLISAMSYQLNIQQNGSSSIRQPAASFNLAHLREAQSQTQQLVAIGNGAKSELRNQVMPAESVSPFPKCDAWHAIGSVGTSR